MQRALKLVSQGAVVSQPKSTIAYTNYEAYALCYIGTLLSVPLIYHSMGQIIKSVFLSVYVCLCAHAYGRIFQPIFKKFVKNLWNPKMPFPILAPKTKILGASIGISSQICKNFKSSYLQNYTWD